MWKADGPELSALEGRRSRQGPPQESLMESLEVMVGAIVLPQVKALT
jgi:hypothetical protein